MKAGQPDAYWSAYSNAYAMPHTASKYAYSSAYRYTYSDAYRGHYL